MTYPSTQIARMSRDVAAEYIELSKQMETEADRTLLLTFAVRRMSAAEQLARQTVILAEVA